MNMLATDLKELTVVIIPEPHLENEPQQACASLHVRVPDRLAGPRLESVVQANFVQNHFCTRSNVHECMFGAVLLPDNYDSKRISAANKIIVSSDMMKLTLVKIAVVRRHALFLR